MQCGDWVRAFRIASKFPRLGRHRAAILSAHGACVSPGFFEQIGKSPAALIEAGTRALVEKYGK
jgi:hypothetical protein